MADVVLDANFTRDEEEKAEKLDGGGAVSLRPAPRTGDATPESSASAEMAVPRSPESNAIDQLMSVPAAEKRLVTANPMLDPVFPAFKFLDRSIAPANGAESRVLGADATAALEGTSAPLDRNEGDAIGSPNQSDPENWASQVAEPDQQSDNGAQEPAQSLSSMAAEGAGMESESGGAVDAEKITAADDVEPLIVEVRAEQERREAESSADLPSELPAAEINPQLSTTVVPEPLPSVSMELDVIPIDQPASTSLEKAEETADPATDSAAASLDRDPEIAKSDSVLTQNEAEQQKIEVELGITEPKLDNVSNLAASAVEATLEVIEAPAVPTEPTNLDLIEPTSLELSGEDDASLNSGAGDAEGPAQPLEINIVPNDDSRGMELVHQSPDATELAIAATPEVSLPLIDTGVKDSVDEAVVAVSEHVGQSVLRGDEVEVDAATESAAVEESSKQPSLIVEEAASLASMNAEAGNQELEIEIPLEAPRELTNLIDLAPVPNPEPVTECISMQSTVLVKKAGPSGASADVVDRTANELKLSDAMEVDIPIVDPVIDKVEVESMPMMEDAAKVVSGLGTGTGTQSLEESLTEPAKVTELEHHPSPEVAPQTVNIGSEELLDIAAKDVLEIVDEPSNEAMNVDARLDLAPDVFESKDSLIVEISPEQIPVIDMAVIKEPENELLDRAPPTVESASHAKVDAMDLDVPVESIEHRVEPELEEQPGVLDPEQVQVPLPMPEIREEETVENEVESISKEVLELAAPAEIPEDENLHLIEKQPGAEELEKIEIEQPDKPAEVDAPKEIEDGADIPEVQAHLVEERMEKDVDGEVVELEGPEVEQLVDVVRAEEERVEDELKDKVTQDEKEVEENNDGDKQPREEDRMEIDVNEDEEVTDDKAGNEDVEQVPDKIEEPARSPSPAPKPPPIQVKRKLTPRRPLLQVRTPEKKETPPLQVEKEPEPMDAFDNPAKPPSPSPIVVTPAKRPPTTPTRPSPAKKPRAVFRTPISKPAPTLPKPEEPEERSDKPKGGPFLPPHSYLSRVAREEPNVRACLLLARIHEGLHDLSELPLFPEEGEEVVGIDLVKAGEYYRIAAGAGSEEGMLGLGRLLVSGAIKEEDEEEEAEERREEARGWLTDLAGRGNLEAMKLLAEHERSKDGGKENGEGEGVGEQTVDVAWLQRALSETGWDDDAEEPAKLDAHGVPKLPSEESGRTIITPSQLLHLLKNPPDSAPLPRPLPRLKYLVQAYEEHKHLPSLMQALPALLALSPGLGLKYLDAEKRNDAACCRYLARLLGSRYGDPAGSFVAYKLLADSHGFAADPEVLESVCSLLLRGARVKGVEVPAEGGIHEVTKDPESAKRYLFSPDCPANIKDRFADLLCHGDAALAVALPGGGIWEVSPLAPDLETAVALWDSIGARWGWWKAACALEEAGTGPTPQGQNVDGLREAAFRYFLLAAASESPEGDPPVTSKSITGDKESSEPTIREQACRRVAECLESGFGVEIDRRRAMQWTREAAMLEMERSVRREESVEVE